MKIEILEKENFTISDLLFFVEKARDEVKIYESCFTKEYTIKNINYLFFESIYDIFDEKNEVVTVSDFSNKFQAIYIYHLRDFSNKYPQILHLPINRDIEDGFVFRNFDTAILSDTKLILL